MQSFAKDSISDRIGSLTECAVAFSIPARFLDLPKDSEPMRTVDCLLANFKEVLYELSEVRKSRCRFHLSYLARCNARVCAGRGSVCAGFPGAR
jgi:hypothetical protein